MYCYLNLCTIGVRGFRVNDLVDMTILALDI